MRNAFAAIFAHFSKAIPKGPCAAAQVSHKAKLAFLAMRRDTTVAFNPDFPLTHSRQVIGGEFDRQVTQN